MPAELLADGKQKRRGSQTFAYPVIRPWLPFNQNKQRCQPTPEMILQTPHANSVMTYHHKWTKTLPLLLIELYQIAKFDDRRNRQVTSKKICLPSQSNASSEFW